MNEIKSTIAGIAIGALITIGILIFTKGCENRPIESKVQYVYKTDTIMVDVPFKVTDTLVRITPPKTVTIYNGINLFLLSIFMVESI